MNPIDFPFPCAIMESKGIIQAGPTGIFPIGSGLYVRYFFCGMQGCMQKENCEAYGRDKYEKIHSA